MRVERIRACDVPVTMLRPASSEPICSRESSINQVRGSYDAIDIKICINRLSAHQWGSFSHKVTVRSDERYVRRNYELH